MAEGLPLVNRFAPLLVEVDLAGGGERFVFERGDSKVWIIDRRENPNEFPELTESGFARMVCTGRTFSGDTSIIKEVHVTHPEPSYRAEYDRIFRAPVVFGSDRNALLADDFWMNLKPPSPSPPMLDVLKAHSEALLQQLKSSKSTRGRVERLLAGRLPSGDASMDAIARHLGLSRQSLFRKL